MLSPVCGVHLHGTVIKLFGLKDPRPNSMCGIGGYSGNFDPVLLERMNGSLRHRGPDGEGKVVFGEAGVGLCHRRLAIIDLSPSGAQPMEDGTGRAWISFNGEIYNYLELRRALEARGHRFRSKSDTEVLIRLYLEFGTDMLARLNGIFAFALWDAEKKQLFLARDQLGVKPLYYATPTPGFVFASEARALLHEPSLERAIDREALNPAQQSLTTRRPQELLRGIKRLEPGCAMVVRNGKIERSWRYYDLPQPGHSFFRSDAEAVEATRESVRQAVHRQMIADVPVAALLSGGLDSSGVVAFAKEVAPGGHIACFTAAMDSDAMREEGFVDDLPYARRVAQHLDVPLHEVPISSGDFLSAQDFLAQADFPIVDPAAFNTYFLAQAARRGGYKV
ncbi:MAG: asparagine synthase (glutamine-hydrolyzing), partial [Burkholderiales bacterium]